MTTATILWRRIDEPGHDACRLTRADTGWLVQGTAVFPHDGTPALSYAGTCDRAWHTRAATVNGWIGSEPVALTVERTVHGRWLLDGTPVPGLDGCVDVDFGFTPATNLPQLRRLALEIGQAAEYSVAWLDVPPGNLTRLAQATSASPPARTHTTPQASATTKSSKSTPPASSATTRDSGWRSKWSRAVENLQQSHECPCGTTGLLGEVLVDCG